MIYPITEIASILGIKAKNLHHAHISHLLTDSRSLFYPDETLFFALETDSNDGHKYISELYGFQVRNFVVQKMLPEWVDFKDANFLVVKDTLKSLQRLASYHRHRFEIPVVGITGSNGKTIVKEWIYQLLQPVFNVTRSPRSYNSQIGVPLSVWQLDKDSQVGVFEAGISKPDEMAKLEKIISPTIGVITNIGDAHQENFKTLKQKCLEKLELFANCEVIICEEGNKLIEECMEELLLSPKRFTWSMKRSDTSPLQILNLERKENITEINYSFLDLNFSVEIPFTDETSIKNATTALAVTSYLHAPFEIIKERLAGLETVAMRLDVRSGKFNNIIINDTYNSDINSLKIALDFLVQRSAETDKKKTLVLSDILQSGIQSKALYNRVLEMILQKRVDRIIGIGKEISRHREIFQVLENYFFRTTEEFIASGLYEDFRNDIILLKGSRKFGFERISGLLEKKTHETVLEIDLDAIIHNYNYYRSQLEASTKIICMVKADGYGGGGVEIAKTLQHHKCDYLAVAVAEEGLLLRKEGIKLPIIVLNPEVNGFDELFTNSLEPEVYNFRILDAFIKEAQKRGITNYPVHLKVDTGMNRLGFSEKDIPELISILNNQKGLHITSVFSHLAASERWNFDDFTNRQIETFRLLSGKIEKGCGYPVMKHILNSGGIERFTDKQMDMVRLGISLYGISPSGRESLKNVCRLRTTILQIKEVPLDETVGYGRKGILDHNALIATIRIGYADGLDRRFGNGTGKVFVNGNYAPFVGDICMDLSMIDVTGMKVKEGDPVVIFGREMPLLEIASQTGTIPYEILTSVSSRVKRIYFKE